MKKGATPAHALPQARQGLYTNTERDAAPKERVRFSCASCITPAWASWRFRGKSARVCTLN